MLRGGHLKLRLRQQDTIHDAIAWRWREQATIPEQIDVAFRLSMNRWQGEERLQLEIQALRAHHSTMHLQRGQKTYSCERLDHRQISLTNPEGAQLMVHTGDNGLLQCDDSRASHPYVASLIQDAAIGLGLQP